MTEHYPQFTDDGDIQLSPHFFLSEFRCKCGETRLKYPGDYCNGAVIPCIPLVGILEEIRSSVNRPVTVVSGYRCNGYHRFLYERINRKRRQAGLPLVIIPTGSAHLWGEAVDIDVFMPKSDEGWLKNLGVTGIGYNIGGTQTATHIDIHHKRFTTWHYG